MLKAGSEYTMLAQLKWNRRGEFANATRMHEQCGEVASLSLSIYIYIYIVIIQYYKILCYVMLYYIITLRNFTGGYAKTPLRGGLWSLAPSGTPLHVRACLHWAVRPLILLLLLLLSLLSSLISLVVLTNSNNNSNTNTNNNHNHDTNTTNSTTSYQRPTRARVLRRWGVTWCYIYVCVYIYIYIYIYIDICTHMCIHVCAYVYVV